MKKFSTAALLLALSAGFGSMAHAQAVKPARCEFLANAPDQHVVVRGDTLWGISGQFLQHPWCWPQVWGLNQEQIRNPHWIYPGQIVYFDRANGRLRLGNAAGDPGVVKLSPQTRVQGLGRDAIAAISTDAIGPFLSQPLIIEDDDLKTAPHIVGVQDGHLNLGKGDKAYVRGDLTDATAFQVFRPGNPLKDPDTGKVIANEALYLGSLKLERKGSTPDEAATFSVVDTKEEMQVGDRIIPRPVEPIMNYVPHAPAGNVNARVVSIYGGVSTAAQNQILTVNRGKADNIDIGTVLQLYRLGKVVKDPADNNNKVKLPDEQYGTLFIFRVFNHISYGLIMEVRNTVDIGDIARSPE
ncbi:LysM peptidoglycan-binding domain-containing protein [Collimonas silvisoli]|uniref:LysM peptidoglycan-binding domain-containing protein n=1 Tax=Collimonas silvisoli TaxID=2825884 RepID=UPI001B8C3CB0|nr:LysM peptidoglycan-binding domain-containing protein [Collimonas silvisoli]